MVCVYCSNETYVVNSRHQKKLNQVWRRRQCRHCQAVFTTLETLSTTQALRVTKNQQLEPFSRDKLLFSVHDSLRHRPTALTDASALTDTILSRLYSQFDEATISPEHIIQTVYTVLSNFDAAAATHYQAFHPI